MNGSAMLGVLLTLSGAACAMELASGGDEGGSPSVTVIEPDSPAPFNDPPGVLNRVEEGFASFYGKSFEGRRTASGLPFNPGAATAAHRSLPFGTSVRITNLENGRSVTATINDRGPYVGQLGFVRTGMARVQVEILGWGPVRRLRGAVESLQDEKVARRHR
jgi:rare lipoprotein A (peptidoglycan hydrolase)